MTLIVVKIYLGNHFAATNFQRITAAQTPSIWLLWVIFLEKVKEWQYDIKGYFMVSFFMQYTFFPT